MVAPARESLALVAGRLLGESPDRPVYSNLDASPHPDDLAVIAARLGDHLASPVRFADMIEAMHRDGARVFVEVGPGSILTPLIDAILKDRAHLTVACDPPGPSGLAGWLRAIARLVAAGLPLDLEPLTRGRSERVLDIDLLPAGENAEALSPSTWLVNGSRARPFSEPETTRLGQARPGPQVALESQNPVSSNGFHAKKTNVANGAPSSTRPVARHPVVQHNEHPVGTGPAIPRSIAERNNNINAHNDTNTSSRPSSSTDRVLESFQQTMQAFLEVQKLTMLAYLASRGAPGSSDRPVFRTETEDRGIEALGPEPVSRFLNGTDHETRQSGLPEEHANGVVAVQPIESHGANANGNGKLLASHSASSAAAGPDRSTITTRLLETVRDRTGYPIETLGLDLDMEADLGIDSIKRVEILGKLRDEFPGLKALSDSPEMMDAMTRARTLGVIVDRMTSLAEHANVATGESEKPAGPSSVAMTNGNGKHDRGTLRRLLKVALAPLPRERAGLMEQGRIVITDDGHGVARGLEKQLMAAGIPVERIGGPETPVDWTSPAAVESVVNTLRSQGPLAGIVHVLPLGHAASSDRIAKDWSARVGVEVKGLFLMAKAMASDLEYAARAGGACLIAATALGGRFANVGGGNAEFFPGHGGIAGLVKTLAREWPAVRSRVVDFSAADPIESVVDRLDAELFARDGWAEVGYDRDRRIRLKTVDRPLEHLRPRRSRLEPGEPSGPDFRGSAGYHGPGGGRDGAALAADALDRRHDTRAR